MTTIFAGYPSVFVHADADPEIPPTKEQVKSRVKHLIWGDEIEERLEQGQPVKKNGWIKVRSRGTNGWVREDQVQAQRLLEVNFIDCRQGDSQYLVTPDGKIVLIDTGEGEHLYRFLRYRYIRRPYGTTEVPVVHFDAAVLSHFDQDHYLGLKFLLAHKHFTFGSIYHNGVIQRNWDPILGPRVRMKSKSFQTGLVTDRASLDAILGDASLNDHNGNLAILEKAIGTGRVNDIRMLSADDGYLPGFGPGSPVQIKVLGPAPVQDDTGKPVLPWFGNAGKTKNGHSVVLLVVYDKVKLLLAGDLNEDSEQYLLRHYAGATGNPDTPEELDALALQCRPVFGADIYKFPHHGSNDFCRSFMKSVDPIVTIVSSGDEESYCHPRAETLGAIGKLSRSDWPMIFSTELARSSSEKFFKPIDYVHQYEDLQDKLKRARSEEKKKEYEEQLKKMESVERTVAVYGMINVRTDGQKVVVAQKMEQPTPRKEYWDIHRLEANIQGVMTSIP